MGGDGEATSGGNKAGSEATNPPSTLEAAAADLAGSAAAHVDEDALGARARVLGGQAFVRRHEAGVGATPPQAVPVTEFHVCAGLNACQGHDVHGKAPMAGTGECATSQHVCHGAGACRGQGGCGYSGSAYEQAIPAEQACSHHGSCASPINEIRVSTLGPNKGKSVWKLARKLFEARMFDAEVQFQPAPREGTPDDLVPSYVTSVPGVHPGPAPDAPGSLCRVPHPDGLAHDTGSDPNLCRATKPST
jgi:hypothetical protein